MEHVFCVVYDREEKELFIQTQLVNHKNFLRRIWSALKYILGYKCKYGAWEETVLDKEGIEKLSKFIAKCNAEVKEF